MGLLRALELVVFLHFLGVVRGFDAVLQSEINPGCKECNNKSVTLMYVKSIGKTNILHNLWDFTDGKPTIIFATTDLNTTLSVSWDSKKLTPSNFTFSNTPTYSFGIVIDKIWEFNDVNDTGIFNPDITQSRQYDTKGMVWERNEVILDEAQAMVKVTSNAFGRKKKKGNIVVKIDMFPYTAYAFDLPHLIHSANSSLIDIVLENMTMTHNYNNSRFAVELKAISTEKSDSMMMLYLRKGLDDEHTPGIFEIIELITPETYNGGDGGFLQYRPVTYISPVRTVASSTKVYTGELTKNRISNDTTAYNYFKNVKDPLHLLVENFTILFGTKGDGFYKKTNYTLWSFTAGYGVPPSEGFSLLVILILSIGLGIPVLLIIVGGIYICIRRHKNYRNSHNILEED